LAQSSLDPNLVYDLDHWEIKKGDKCERGSQLRPNVVWFGEPVPKMLEAIDIAQKADIFLIIGTSLQVYPAASIVDYAPSNIPIYLIDPNSSFYSLPKNLTHFQKSATEGMKILKEVLI
jgi:NAD-dependent deacetylase